MRKIVMILALMSVAVVTLKAQTGAWTGKLKVRAWSWRLYSI